MVDLLRFQKNMFNRLWITMNHYKILAYESLGGHENISLWISWGSWGLPIFYYPLVI
jgi:hypothetical protein